uniref:EF-hand domain-containing protein n=1 Tax=Macrostomum lignano TaxID=282301 RepID=A0A1I8HF34_9PLAT
SYTLICLICAINSLTDADSPNHLAKLVRAGACKTEHFVLADQSTTARLDEAGPVQHPGIEPMQLYQRYPTCLGACFLLERCNALPRPAQELVSASSDALLYQDLLRSFASLLTGTRALNLEKALDKSSRGKDTAVQELKKRIADAFEIFDHEANQTVDVREVGTIIRSLGCCPTEGELHDILKEMEEEEPLPYVTFDAFLGVAMKILQEKRYKPALEDQLLKAFQVLDIENNGYLTKEEIEKYMVEEGEPFSTEELEEMLSAAIDPEKGTVIYKEYVPLLVVDDAPVSHRREQHRTDLPSACPVARGASDAFTASSLTVGSGSNNRQAAQPESDVDLRGGYSEIGARRRLMVNRLGPPLPLLPPPPPSGRNMAPRCGSLLRAPLPPPPPPPAPFSAPPPSADLKPTRTKPGSRPDTWLRVGLGAECDRFTAATRRFTDPPPLPPPPPPPAAPRRPLFVFAVFVCLNDGAAGSRTVGLIFKQQQHLLEPASGFQVLRYHRAGTRARTSVDPLLQIPEHGLEGQQMRLEKVQLGQDRLGRAGVTRCIRNSVELSRAASKAADTWVRRGARCRDDVDGVVGGVGDGDSRRRCRYRRRFVADADVFPSFRSTSNGAELGVCYRTQYSGGGSGSGSSAGGGVLLSMCTSAEYSGGSAGRRKTRTRCRLSRKPTMPCREQRGTPYQKSGMMPRFSATSSDAFGKGDVACGTGGEAMSDSRWDANVGQQVAVKLALGPLGSGVGPGLVANHPAEAREEVGSVDGDGTADADVDEAQDGVVVPGGDAEYAGIAVNARYYLKVAKEIGGNQQVVFQHDDPIELPMDQYVIQRIQVVSGDSPHPVLIAASQPRQTPLPLDFASRRQRLQRRRSHRVVRVLRDDDWKLGGAGPVGGHLADEQLHLWSAGCHDQHGRGSFVYGTWLSRQRCDRAQPAEQANQQRHQPEQQQGQQASWLKQSALKASHRKTADNCCCY